MRQIDREKRSVLFATHNVVRGVQFDAENEAARDGMVLADRIGDLQQNAQAFAPVSSVLVGPQIGLAQSKNEMGSKN